jgi:hypothetical protein
MPISVRANIPNRHFFFCCHSRIKIVGNHLPTLGILKLLLTWRFPAWEEAPQCSRTLEVGSDLLYLREGTSEDARTAWFGLSGRR